MNEVDQFLYHTVTGTIDLMFGGEILEKIKLAPHMTREEVQAEMSKRGWEMGDDFVAKTYSMNWYLY